MMTLVEGYEQSDRQDNRQHQTAMLEFSEIMQRK